LPLNHLPGENRGAAGRIGEVRLTVIVRDMRDEQPQHLVNANTHRQAQLQTPYEVALD
jgi:hypothetical protein